MKKLYSLTTLSLALLFLVRDAAAQTTYTAVRNGYWHVESGTNQWATVEPPSDCKNCTIIISPGVTLTLNTNVLLEQSSSLIIGSASSSDAALLTIGGSGASGINWSTAYNLVLLNDGSSPANKIVLTSSNALINAAGVTSQFDGIFTAFLNPGSDTSYYKQIGKGALGFSGTKITNYGTSTPPPTTLSGSITLSADGTLPIVLSAFTATLNNKEVDLAWTTDMEANADHYAIQRSADAGAHWLLIGTVAAKGNSSVATNYSFVDTNPVSGTSEYRLQSVDKDAKFTYSDIKTVRNGLIGTVNIFPNPAKDYVNITLGSSDNATGNLSVRLISQSGQLLVDKKVTNTGGTTVSLAVGSYPQGNYLIQVTGADGTQQISKLFISRQ